MSGLLQLSRLNVSFLTSAGSLRAVENVSFEIRERETVALVGESGCGKSVTALALLRLIPQNVGRIEADEMSLRGRNLLTLSGSEMRRVRGGEIAMIFQEPMTSLNPVFTVGEQLSETIRLHREVPKKEVRNLAAEALKAVGIPDPIGRLNAYPHELSGGMRQRVMIAMAVACRPALLIADEPTTALDVTIQAQILELLRKLQDELGMAILLITHDLGIVAETSHRVLVMYAGQIVEEATTERLFTAPQHPYTLGLLNAVPKLTGDQTRLVPVEGTVPDIASFPPACRFEPRCPWRRSVCRRRTPTLELLEDTTHLVRCFAISRDTEYIEESPETPEPQEMSGTGSRPAPALTRS